MNRTRRVLAALTAAAALTSLSACLGPLAVDPTSTASSNAQKQGDGALRTDLEPLTSRFPVLGQPVSAQWMSGTLGDSRLPGPSTYWIDAIVVVTPEVAAELAPLASETGTPDLVAGVAELVPPGTLRTSEQIDARFSTDTWWVDAYLVEGSDTVVLAARGD
ncbi:hypothetical protein [Propioniciclava sp.]|uniref:hypothetical protein n=1 Tax=Propioniciclava sp. TaxID=2038686 RepID=UPI00260533D6|nr:hypothetical protein [Propioniciclava sp.]